MTRIFQRLTAFILIFLFGCTMFPLPLFAKDAQEASVIVSKMTLRQKIAQMIVPSFRNWTDQTGAVQPVTSLNSSLRELLAEENFGGVILFSENFASTEQTVTLTNDLQSASLSNSSSIPLIIAADQEGGRVARLNSGCSMPGNMALGAVGSTEAAKLYGSIVGSELAACGINTNFAPDMDVNSNPSNPVIGVRSFGEQAEAVSSLGLSVIEGLHSEGVAATVKHFPGHGDTSTDSHTSLPLVNKSYEEIKQLELVPFQAALDTADVVMTAHIQYPQIEKNTYISKQDGAQVNLPATLSKVMITDVLRNDMGYKGVVSTDALNMGAIADNFDPMDVAELAINAGVDILLMPVTVESEAGVTDIKNYITGIEQLVKDGKIDEQTITQSAERMIQMKQKRGILNYKEDTRSVAQKILDAQSITGSKAHHAAERSIAAQAVTIIENKNYTLPLEPKDGQKILLFGAYENTAAAMAYGITRLQKEGVLSQKLLVEAMDFTKKNNEDYEAKVASILEQIKSADYVLVSSEISNQSQLNPSSWLSGTPDRIIAQANAVGVPVVVLSNNIPYDAARYPEADALAVCYNPKGLTSLGEDGEPNAAYGPNVPAAMDILFGKTQPTGKLPVSVPEIQEYSYTNHTKYAVGYGITNLTKPSTPAQSSSSPVTPVKPAVGATSSSESVTSKSPVTGIEEAAVLSFAIIASVVSGILLVMINKKRV